MISPAVWNNGRLFDNFGSQRSFEKTMSNLINSALSVDVIFADTAMTGSHHVYVRKHYDDVIMGAMATQITNQTTVCLLNRLFRRKSKRTSKLRVTGLCVGNSPETGEFPAQMASSAENVSIWWRHHENNLNGSLWSVTLCDDSDTTQIWVNVSSCNCWCLTAPRHYLIQSWLIISEILWH